VRVAKLFLVSLNRVRRARVSSGQPCGKTEMAAWHLRPHPILVGNAHAIARQHRFLPLKSTRPLSLSSFHWITLDDHIRVGTERRKITGQRAIRGLHRDPLGNDVRQLAQVGRILVEVR